MSFEISIQHKNGRSIKIEGASSILNPRDNTVMFIGKKFIDKVDSLFNIRNCLVFVLSDLIINPEIEEYNKIVKVDNPRKSFGRFLEENHAELLPETEYITLEGGALVSINSSLGKNVSVFPFAFIDRDVTVGENTIIHSGVRLLPKTRIGRNCEIHENTVIGTIGLAYEENQRIPQIGGIVIGDNVSIGAGCVIARGAIDDTEICDNVAIDSTCFVSHNVKIGKNCKLVAGANLFGSVIVEDGAYISGNAVIRNGINIGEGSVVGMGSVVIKDVLSNSIVVGNPAKVLEK